MSTSDADTAADPPAVVGRTASGDEGEANGDGFDDPNDEIETLDLTTAGIGEMLPGVLAPLVWSIDAHLVEEAFRHLLDDLGVVPKDLVEPRGLVRRVNGRAAMDFSRLQGMAGSLPGSSSASLEAEYFGSRRREREAAPATPGTLGRLRRATHDVRVVRARHRALVEVEVLVGASTSIAGDDRALPSSDAELLAYQRRLVDLATRGMAAELAVAADATATYRRLQVMLARHVSSPEAGRLADRAVARAGVAVPVSAAASAAVFAGPTWAEIGRNPPTPARRNDAVDDGRVGFEGLRAELEAAPGWHAGSMMSRLRLRAMRRLAAETTLRLGLRERAKAALLELGGEVRRVHLEAGRRLVARGELDDVADVDLLTPSELHRALLGREVPVDVLAHRRRWQQRYAQLGPLPARFTGRPEYVEVERTGGTYLEGWAASAGRFRGIATVVRSPDDDLPHGAVLVAEATDPSWSPLFLEAGAIVLDRGGPLSHAAILAREIGVPAVLNVAGATELLAGHEVTVDGDHGIVIVHDGTGS